MYIAARLQMKHSHKSSSNYAYGLCCEGISINILHSFANVLCINSCIERLVRRSKTVA